ncbi:beta-galactosidase [Jannaschia aquimarina]|uniref:Beta-galactosidase n=1 Tax=Jannaschia aquimarina TaxID=935700 RepID=A0A0D1CIF6_9RHOB|nr:beta-galactosidase [Jannaschia aquimarina]KIT14497.1 Beta-galactosidase [Jannaschia aquimarina]SNT28536.1 beta-galactosidase [Jannaschia aquimarina]
MKRTLGVCYYPEHWPEDRWATDATMMAEAGLTWVRIGEFAWSRLEPAPGELRFDWLARAIDTLRGAGLKIVLGTPSATPPHWMLDRHPDMLAVDAEGRPRKFGSRRHYCFSHVPYRDEAARMARLLAERFPDVDAWQTDNEYGCHDTILSWSDAARDAFRDWLRERYSKAGANDPIGALNAHWGNVFWSMDYADFDQIDLPNLTVTEPNPAHLMAFRRFSSDQVARWNAAQVEAIRVHSDAPISHNYMGRITEFDHYDLGRQMEIATWDSYPLGFLLDRVPDGDAQAYLRQGDPDFQAFHHDLYRAVAAQAPGDAPPRWWVMEQQPGPVNWAPHNPAPLPGMVRLWTWEAFAHGAEAVCYFRWRQAPFAQESHHAGLLRPDAEPAPGLAEARAVAAELADAPDVASAQAPVALVFDYASQWAWEVQPQGKGFDHFALAFHLYRALRSLGLGVDILPPDAPSLDGYALTLIPSLMTLGSALRGAIEEAPGIVLTGPRTDLRGPDLAMHVPLGPHLPGLDVTATLVETLPPHAPRALRRGGALTLWLEHLETDAAIVEHTTDGLPALVRSGNRAHLAGWPDMEAARRILRDLATEAGLDPIDMPEGVRRRGTATETFLFNYAAEDREFAGHRLPPAGVLRLPDA